jgi:hypothetical protein
MPLRELLVFIFLIVLVSQAIYVLGPIKLHESTKIHIHRRVRTMTPDDERRADATLLAHVEQGERSLAAAGFGPPHRIVSHDSPGMFAFASLLEHPAGDIATVMAIRSTNGPAPSVVAAVTLMGDAANGKRIASSNVTSIKRFPTNPRYDAAVFPALRDAGELYAVHQSRFKSAGRSPKPLSRGATESARLTYQDAEARESYDFWVAAGYYYETPDFLRPTWKGAAFSTWRGLFPWRHVTEQRRNGKSAAILAEYRTASAASTA